MITGGGLGLGPQALTRWAMVSTLAGRSVTTTGLKTATITHGLVATPDINNVVMSFAKPSINYDSAARFSAVGRHGSRCNDDHL